MQWRLHDGAKGEGRHRPLQIVAKFSRAPKLWQAPHKFSRALDTLWSIDSPKAMLSNSTRKLLWFEASKIMVAV